MASSMRTVRRQLRKELLGAIGNGDGVLPQLIEIADRLLGRNVGYEVLIKTFCANEVSNALAQLRLDEEVETTGKCWKLVSKLEDEDVDIISTRRLKRLRGELKAEIRLAHDHGRIDDAALASEMLAMVQGRLPFEAEEAAVEVATESAE